MAFPAAPTESGGAKLHFLNNQADAAQVWFAVTEGSTAGGNPVGFAGIATHVEGDTVAAPGGLNTSDTDVPVVLVAGDDGANVVPLQLSGSDLKITLDSELVVLGAGSAEIGKLGAGTAAIGKLASNSGVDIGDVDVITMPGTAAEAAALPSAFVVVAGDDGADTHPLQVDASGYLKMSIEVDNVGIGGGTQYAVDAPLGATPTGTLAIAIRDDALGGLTPIEGDAIGLRVDANGALWTHDDVLEAALAGNQLQVDIVAALPAGTNNIGDVDVLTLPATAAEAAALPSVFVVVAGDDGTDTHPLQVAADGDLKVTLDSEAVVLGTGSATIGKLAANDGVDIGNVDVASLPSLPAGTNNIGDIDVLTMPDVLVEGDIVHDALDSGGGGPMKIGGRAQSSEAQPDEVADNDRVDALFDRSGYLRVRGDFDPQSADINDASSGNNTIIAAQAAGKRIAVWSILIVADGTVDVRFEDGAAGTALTGQIPLQAREGFSYSAGGLVPLWVGSAATLLNLELSAAIAVHGSLSFSVIDD